MERADAHGPGYFDLPIMLIGINKLFPMHEPLASLMDLDQGIKGVIYAFICQVLGRTPPMNGLRENSSINWALIGKITELEGMSPLIYWQLNKSGWPAEIPAEMRQGWARSYYHNVAQNTLVFQELERILVAFGLQGIPLMLLKGAVLALFVYKDIGLRPMNDLDLLVPEHCVEEALEKLAELGYCEAEQEVARGINRRVLHNVYLRGGPDGRVGLELHWNLIAGEGDDRAVSSEWFWEHLESRGTSKFFRNRDLEIPHLCPTAHLLYLAAHLVLRHGGEAERLIWFYDIDQLVCSGDIDWEMLIAQARGLDWGPLTRYTLEKASLYLDTSIPANILNRLADETAWTSFLKQQSMSFGHFSRLERAWGEVRHLDLGIRARLLLALILPSPRFLKWRYEPKPDWIWPVYYVRRLGTILREVIRLTIRRWGK